MRPESIFDEAVKSWRDRYLIGLRDSWAKEMNLIKNEDLY